VRQALPSLKAQHLHSTIHISGGFLELKPVSSNQIGIANGGSLNISNKLFTDFPL
jgi:hypothetical protein